jgi:hypothetical protein
MVTSSLSAPFYFTAESGQSLVAHGHAEMLRAPRDEKAL